MIGMMSAVHLPSLTAGVVSATALRNKEADCDDVRVTATGRGDAAVVLVVVVSVFVEVSGAGADDDVDDDALIGVVGEVVSSFCLVAGSNFNISLIDSVLTDGVSDDDVFDVPEAHRLRFVASAVGVVLLSLLLLLLLLFLTPSEDVVTESFRFLFFFYFHALQ